MKNKGFTLIELLAVILILGIISLIAIPTINNVVASARIGSFKDSSLNIVNAISNTCNIELLKGEPITNSYVIAGGEAVPLMNIKGKLPTEGVVNVSDSCDIEMIFTSDKFCSIKNYGSDVVEVGNLEGNDCLLESGQLVASVIAETPSGCFTYTEAGVITAYDYANPACPTDIKIPDSINHVAITEIGKAAFTEDYDYIVYGSSEFGMLDTENNVDYYKQLYMTLYGKELIPDYSFPLNNVASSTKSCYAYEGATAVIKPINYKLTGVDGLAYCTIDEAIAENNYAGTYKITSVNLSSAKHLVKINDSAFDGQMINAVTFGTIPLQEIGISAFSYNNLSNTLMLSSLASLNKIDGCAFESNDIEAVNLPSNLDSIGLGAFYDNKISSINFNGGTKKIYGWAFEINELTNLTISNSTTFIGEGAFSRNKLNNVVIGTSLTGLDEHLFDGNNLTTVTIPSNITSIKDSTFLNNPLLTTININKPLNSIPSSPWGATGATINWLG